MAVGRDCPEARPLVDPNGGGDRAAGHRPGLVSGDGFGFSRSETRGRDFRCDHGIHDPAIGPDVEGGRDVQPAAGDPAGLDVVTLPQDAFVVPGPGGGETVTKLDPATGRQVAAGIAPPALVGGDQVGNGAGFRREASDETAKIRASVVVAVGGQGGDRQEWQHPVAVTGRHHRHDARSAAVLGAGDALTRRADRGRLRNDAPAASRAAP